MIIYILLDRLVIDKCGDHRSLLKIKERKTVNGKHRIVIGMSGASGAPLAIELLKQLRDHKDWLEVHLIVTKGAEMTLGQETECCLEELWTLADVVHDCKNIGLSVKLNSVFLFCYSLYFSDKHYTSSFSFFFFFSAGISAAFISGAFISWAFASEAFAAAALSSAFFSFVSLLLSSSVFPSRSP